MGQTSSKNVTNTTIESLAETNNDVRTTSSDVSVGVNTVNLNNCNDVKNLRIDQSNDSVLRVSTSQSADMTSKLSQQMDTQVAQAAENIRMNLDLNPGSGQATNIMNLTEQMSSQVNNSARVQCGADSLDMNSFSCTNSSGLRDIYVSQKSYRKKNMECINEATTDTDVANAMSTTIDQTSKMETQDALSRVLLLVLLLAVAFIVIRSGGAGGAGAAAAGTSPTGRREASRVFLQLMIICVASAILSLHVTYNCKKKSRGLVPGILPGLHFLRWCKKPDLGVRAQGLIATTFFAGTGVTLLDFMERSSYKVAGQGVALGTWLAGVAYWTQPEERRREWRLRLFLGVGVMVAAGVIYAVMSGKSTKAKPDAIAAASAPPASLPTPAAPTPTPDA